MNIFLPVIPCTEHRKDLGHFSSFAFNGHLYRVLSHNHFVITHFGIYFIMDIIMYELMYFLLL